ncbi:MAG: hypothetical protein AAF721_41930 [Myxococcota bacterium]
MNAGRLTVFLATFVLPLGCAGDDGGDDGAGTGTTAAGTSTGGDEETDVDQNMSDTVIIDTTGGDTNPPADSTDGGETGSGTTAADGGSSGTTSSVAACEGMSFFASSVGSGNSGGNLGGLDGADATCQALADAAGQGSCTWQAYLSTSTVDARDRIGEGPWENFDGDEVAASVMALHDNGLPNGMPQLVMDEYGQPIPGNEHDILTGSTEAGTLLKNATCDDWTTGTDDASAGVGHSDIPNNPQFSPSWVEAHVVNGCAPNTLQSTAGAGRIYCFAL